VGSLLSAVTVTYRDFKHVLPFMMQLWLFATPSIYFQAKGAFVGRGRTMMLLNPAYGLVTNFRAALLGGAFDPLALASAGVISLGLLLVGCLYFRRAERFFPDII
jgi:lipopolysaccharide transport system permease protein